MSQLHSEIMEQPSLKSALVIGISQSGQSPNIVSVLEEVRRQGALTIAVTTRHPDDVWLPVPGGLPEWLTPLVAILPGQLLAYHLTLARGSNPDRPRTLHKVTLTY